MENLKRNTKVKWLRIMYIGSLIVAALLLVTIVCQRTPKNLGRGEDTYTVIDDGWSLTPGGEDYADIRALGQYFAAGSDTLSLYRTVPEIKHAQSLIFRSKDVYCTVYADGELIYEPKIYESRFYNTSPGNNWNFIKFYPEDSGKQIELRIRYVYGTDAVSADTFIWGDKADWALDFVKHKAFAVFLSVAIVIIGIITSCMDINSFKRSENHALLYLGIYGILMGLWSLIETNVLQLFMADGRLLQLMNNLLMITDSIPLFFYLDSEFDISKNRIVHLLAIIDVIYIYVCVVGQFLGLTDLHNYLAGSWIATGISFILLVYILAKQIRALMRGEKIKKTVLIQMIGFLSLTALVIVCIPIYLNSDGIDRAESIRIGMLVMIIMFAISGHLKTRELIMQGTRYDIVKNLAYQDALTGLFNRTSFLETLEGFKSDPPEKLGAIFFDVNNLKTANDQFGHDIGDRLICLAAETIRDSFADFGTAYRTGGDEFLVFLNGTEPEEGYRKGLEIFRRKLANMNESGEYSFKIEIAHGFSLLDGHGEDCLKEMIERADAKMYENKRFLKGLA